MRQVAAASTASQGLLQAPRGYCDFSGDLRWEVVLCDGGVAGSGSLSADFRQRSRALEVMTKFKVKRGALTRGAAVAGTP